VDDVLIDPMSDVPRWRQAYAILADRIRDGTYPPGTRVPSVVALGQELGISIPTAQKTLRALREDGLTHTVPGIGSFVAGESGESVAGGGPAAP
jgi:GntR family transcriptional regulator